jgi:hypothetical protein
MEWGEKEERINSGDGDADCQRVIAKRVVRRARQKILVSLRGAERRGNLSNAQH